MIQAKEEEVREKEQALKLKEEQVKDKDEEILRKNEIIHASEKLVQEREKEVQEKERWLQQKEAEYEESEEESKRQNQREEEIKEKERWLQEREATHQESEEELKRQNQKFEKLKKDLDMVKLDLAQATKARRGQRQLTSSHHVSNQAPDQALVDSLASVTKRSQELEDVVASLTRKNEELEQVVSELKLKNANLEDQARNREKQIGTDADPPGASAVTEDATKAELEVIAASLKQQLKYSEERVRALQESTHSLAASATATEDATKAELEVITASLKQQLKYSEERVHALQEQQQQQQQLLPCLTCEKLRQEVRQRDQMMDGLMDNQKALEDFIEQQDLRIDSLEAAQSTWEQQQPQQEQLPQPLGGNGQFEPIQQLGVLDHGIANGSTNGGGGIGRGAFDDMFG